MDCASARGEPVTPLSTSPLQNGGQPYLPLEVLRNSPMVPPLPTMRREAGPFGSQSRTPAGSPLQQCSPYASPMSSFSQMDMFSIPPSPQPMAQQVQVGFCSPMGQQQPQAFQAVPAAAPQLPPWPFPCAAVPAPQAGGAQMVPGGLVAPQADMQIIAVPVMPGTTGPAPAPASQGMVGQQSPQQGGAFFEGWGQSAMLGSNASASCYGGMPVPGMQGPVQGPFFS